MYPGVVIFGMGFYEIFLIIAMLSALFIADQLGIKRGFSVKLQKIVIVAAVGALVLGIVGAMLFQAVYDWIKTGVFNAFGSGMTFYGGFIFGVLVFLAVWFGGSRLIKIGDEAVERTGDMADIAACIIPLAHAFGRLGCLFAGCCHGKKTDAWYGINMLTESGWQKVVPVQLFEAIFLFALSAVLFFLFFKRAKMPKNERKGIWTLPFLPVYAIVYGVWRFLVEYARGDDRGASGISFLSPSQLTAILLIVVGVAYIVFVFYRVKAEKNKKEE
jgi:phosphatidylglycerol:prolipoprotein diacylglycerol transferase